MKLIHKIFFDHSYDSLCSLKMERIITKERIIIAIKFTIDH